MTGLSIFNRVCAKSKLGATRDFKSAIARYNYSSLETSKDLIKDLFFVSKVCILTFAISFIWFFKNKNNNHNKNSERERETER